MKQGTTAVMEKYKYLADMNISGEDLPEIRNGIDLHPTEKDQHGLPKEVFLNPEKESASLTVTG